MIRLTTLLQDDTVHLNVPCFSRSDILHWIAEYFSARTNLPEKSIYTSLMQREELGSTGLGRSVAIPHGRLRGLTSAHTLFIRTQNTIDFDAPDGIGVNQFFVLLVPEKATDDHLEILSEIAQILSTEHLRHYFAEAATPQEILQALRNHQNPHSSSSQAREEKTVS